MLALLGELRTSYRRAVANCLPIKMSKFSPLPESLTYCPCLPWTAFRGMVVGWGGGGGALPMVE